MSIEKRTQRPAIGLASYINMLIYPFDAHRSQSSCIKLLERRAGLDVGEHG